MESELERLRKKVENYPSASAYNRLAELARLSGDAPDAERICQRCIKEFPRNGQAYVILAEIALAGNRKEDAIKQLATAVERDSRCYSGHRMLADLLAANGDTAAAVGHLRQILAFKPNDTAVLRKIDMLAPGEGAKAAANPPATSTLGTRSVPGTGTGTGTGAGSAMRRQAGTVPAKPSQASEALARKETPARGGSLSELCAEQGVKGAVISDSQGRVVVSQGLADAKAEMLAALTAELSASNANALKVLGHDRLVSWIVDAEQGQVMAFKRDQNLTLSVLSAPGVRAALLELRARQALLDLGVS